MKFNQLTKVAGAVAIVLGLSACGGGSGGGSSASGTAGTASVGTITGFGSVFVNGVEFQTNSTSITIDGTPATETDLAVGMVAHLNGSASGTTGVALSIDVHDELEGAVQSNGVTTPGGTGTLIIMGQNVTVDTNTLFESKVATIPTIDMIAPGNIVEVNGYSDGNGNTIATRIEVKAVDITSYGKSIEVKGVISNLDTVAKTFTLGSLSVDYSSASMGNLTLADGLYVEVKSDTAPVSSGATTTLTANRIDVQDDGKKGQQGSEGEKLKIKGVIASVNGNDFLLMDGTNIITDRSTKFDSEGSINLTKDAMVEVEGQFNTSGDLIARKINIESSDASTQTEYRGLVINVTATGINTGTVTLQDGSVFTVSNTTIMKDSSNSGVHQFNLQQLETAWMNNESPYVQVNAYTDTTSGNLVATKLERDNP